MLKYIFQGKREHVSRVLTTLLTCTITVLALRDFTLPLNRKQCSKYSGPNEENPDCLQNNNKARRFYFFLWKSRGCTLIL